MLDKPDFLAYLKERQASTSVSASTARNMGPKGTIQQARKFLAALELKRFRQKTQKDFLEELNKATEELHQILPKRPGKESEGWGSARKFLNIFLRGCAYNKYLCKHHQLDLIEPWLEIPLDSHVAKGLGSEDGQANLPRWTSVIGLGKEDRQRFQEFASEVARREGVNRVDLDIKYWRRVD